MNADRQLDDELYRLALSQTQIGLYGGLIFGVWIAYVFLPFSDRVWLLRWFAAKTGFVLFRAWLTWFLQQRRDVKGWWNFYRFCLLIDGVGWGVVIFATRVTEWQTLSPLLFGCLLLPTVTATQSLRADWKAFIYYSLPVPLLGVAYFLTRPGFAAGNAAATALPLVIFEALLTAWAYRSYTHLRNSILVRINAETLAQQRLQALAVAEERSRVKSQFMATMTHELRTPLYGILGLSQLARGEHSREALLQRLDLLDKSGESLLAVIDDLLDFSQLESGEVTVRARRVDLHALVREVQGVAAHTAQNKGLDLLVDARLPTPCVVACDPMRVRQVLLQLLGNAFKFTEEGSVRLQVGLEAVEQGVRVRFAVTDTGIGIDAQHLPRIFAPFHQVDGSMGRRYGGVGIGLTRARQIARAMGGDIRCASEPARGSTFTFEFPVAEVSSYEADAPDGERADETDAVSPQGRLAGTRVLLAEDNPINALVIVDQLERLGAQVQAVADGQAAVQSACASPAPDLVLMDCQMPGMDGFEAARRIRAYERKHDRAPVPILAVTALASDADHAACLACGMNGRLVKPVSMRALERELSRLVQLSGLCGSCDADTARRGGA